MVSKNAKKPQDFVLSLDGETYESTLFGVKYKVRYPRTAFSRALTARYSALASEIKELEKLSAEYKEGDSIPDDKQEELSSRSREVMEKNDNLTRSLIKAMFEEDVVDDVIARCEDLDDLLFYEDVLEIYKRLRDYLGDDENPTT